MSEWRSGGWRTQFALLVGEVQQRGSCRTAGAGVAAASVAASCRGPAVETEAEAEAAAPDPALYPDFACR